MTEHKLAKGSLSSKEHQEPEHAVHIKKLHHGYLVHKHHKDGSKTEHAAEDIDGAMEHAEDHLEGGPEDGQMQQGPEMAQAPMAAGGSEEPEA